MVEAAGRDYALKERGYDLNKPVEGVAPIVILEYMINMNENEDIITKESKNIYDRADILLNQPFDFYGTALSLNSE